MFFIVFALYVLATGKYAIVAIWDVKLLQNDFRPRPRPRKPPDPGPGEAWGHSLEMMCLNAGAEIANIEDATENLLVQGWLRNQGSNIYQGVWIGGSDVVEEGRWVYGMTSRRLQYSDWQSGYPTNGARSNCLLMWKAYHFKWIDSLCESAYNVLCKKPFRLNNTMPVG
ncbi:hypothetical protein ScPMuIL_012773 [Solemya velum]